MTRARVLASAILALSGCVMGPDYRRPTVDAPEAFLYAPREASKAGDEAWWRSFGDPVLDRMIVEALAANRNVKIAAANVEQAVGAFSVTRSQLLPQVGYGAQAGRARSSEAGANAAYAGLVPNPENAYQAALSVSWEIDLWGKVRRLSESARASALATNEARRGVILTLVSSVTTTYLGLRGLDEQLAVARRTRDAYLESVKLFELQFQHGQVSMMNVAQARSQYETAAAQIPAIELQIAHAEISLSVLLGRNPGPIERGKSIHELLLPPVPEGLPSTLLERRPDLMQAEQQLIAANAQIGAAIAQYFPSISLTGAFGVASTGLSSLFTGPGMTWSYAGALAGPIFTFGATSGKVAQATAGQQAALEAFLLAIQNAFADVDGSLVASQKLAEQFAAQGRLVDALREYSQLARLQYEGGYSPYMTVLQAEQALFPAELQLASLRAAQFQAAGSLYKAMGGGWVSIAEGMTDGGPPVQKELDAFPSPF